MKELMEYLVDHPGTQFEMCGAEYRMIKVGLRTKLNDKLHIETIKVPVLEFENYFDAIASNILWRFRSNIGYNTKK